MLLSVATLDDYWKSCRSASEIAQGERKSRLTRICENGVGRGNACSDAQRFEEGEAGDEEEDKPGGDKPCDCHDWDQEHEQ